MTQHYCVVATQYWQIPALAKKKKKSHVIIHMWHQSTWFGHKIPRFPSENDAVCSWIISPSLWNLTSRMWKILIRFQVNIIKKKKFWCGKPLSLAQCHLFLKWKTVACDSRQNTNVKKKKSWLLKRGTCLESTCVFNSHVVDIFKLEKMKAAVFNTSTVIHLRLLLCWSSHVVTAWTRFTTSSHPLGWMEIVKNISSCHRSRLCISFTAHIHPHPHPHTQHSAEMHCEIYCNSHPPLSLI